MLTLGYSNVGPVTTETSQLNIVAMRVKALSEAPFDSDDWLFGRSSIRRLCCHHSGRDGFDALAIMWKHLCYYTIEDSGSILAVLAMPL